MAARKSLAIAEALPVSLDAWKNNKPLATTAHNVRLFKSIDATGIAGAPVLKITKDEKSGAVRVSGFPISSEAVDRDTDTISLDGWDLSKYNGVVLFAHSSWEPPVGKSTVYRSGRFLAADVEFVSRELSDFGGMIGEMVAEKFLRSASVGFRPLDWKMSDDRESPSGYPGYDFAKQELLEWSVVPVPSNWEATIEGAKAAKIDVAPFMEFARKTLDVVDVGGLYVPRKSLEAILKRPQVVVAEVVKDEVEESAPAGGAEDLPGAIAKLTALHGEMKSTGESMAKCYKDFAALHAAMKATAIGAGDSGNTQDIEAAAIVEATKGSTAHALSGAQYKRVKSIRKMSAEMLAAHHAADAAADPDGDGDDDSADGKAAAEVAAEKPVAPVEEPRKDSGVVDVSALFDSGVKRITDKIADAKSKLN